MSDQEYSRQFRRYVIGLIALLAIVYTAYIVAVYGILSGTLLAVLLLSLAVVQLIIQMVVFLHVLDETKPRWIGWSVVYGFLMMLVIVIASLWIMANMNYNMHMSPDQMKEFMIEQNKKGF